MRKLYWYLSSYARKHGLVLAISVIVAILGFSLVIPFVARTIEQKPRIYMGVVGQYSLYNLPRPIKELMSSGLTQIQEDGSPAPALSERWSLESDDKVYRFVLKKDLFWQDEKPMEPSDLKYNFQDAEEVFTPNDVVFKLPDSFVPFPGVVSEPIFRTVDKRTMFFFKKPFLIGTGAYEMLDYQEKGPRLTELTLDSREERRIYRFYLTEDDAVLAFKRGEIDVLDTLSSPKDIGEWPTVTVKASTDYQQYLAVFFNFEDALFSKNVRQALSYAATKPSDDTRAIGPIGSKSWAYLNSAKDYEYDMARATERLLAEIPGVPMNIELTTTPIFQDTAQQLKQEWEKLGEVAFTECQSNKIYTDKAACDRLKTTVSLKITSFPDTNNYQLLLLGQESPADPDQYYLWHSDITTNFSKYKNTRIDSLLEKGRTTSDQKERLAIYQEFQQFLLEDAPAVFLYHLQDYQVSRK